jgi:RNA polymerase sigma-70 factor (ECF subfamily)
VLLPLVDAYERALDPAARERAGTVPRQTLAESLDLLCARGHAGHPGVAVSDETFVEHLARCGAPVPAGPERVFAEDLYLACACLLGDAPAIAGLRAAQRPVLAGYLRRIDGSKPFVDEIEQRLWDAVLVGAEGAPPKLATYSGEGPMAGWLGIAAQRIALMMLRHEGAEDRAHKGAAAEARLAVQDPELAFMKGHLRGRFQEAVSKALGVLGDRERMIYRMHLIDGLSLDRIAKMYGVSQSTVSRWLAAARASVLGEGQRVLRDEMQLSAGDFESMAGLMVSQLDLSVSRLLRAPPRKKNDVD